WRYACRRHSVIHSGSSFFADRARMVSSSRPGGRESDSMSVMKPAEYLRPSCSWISRLGVSSVTTVSMMSVAMGAACGSGDDSGRNGAALGVVNKGKGGEDLGEGDRTQCLGHHVVDQPPAAACAALGRHVALVVVVAAFG